MPRPTKFTDDIKKKLLIAIRKGAPYEHACKYAKVSYSLFCEWRGRGRNNESPFAEFMDDIKEAEAETSLIWLDKIDKAMNEGSWQAAAWKLERRYPMIYGRDSLLLKKAQELIDKADKVLDKESINGQKMDTGNAYEERRLTQGTSCARGQENRPSQTC